MNREQMADRMVQRAGQILDWSDDGLPLTQHEAEMLLDAVLPQITTVAELEALPPNSKVLDERGGVWRKGSDWFYGTAASERCTYPWLALTPVTVVWTPEPVTCGTCLALDSYAAGYREALGHIPRRPKKPAPVKCETCLDHGVVSRIIGGRTFTESCPDCVLHDPGWAS